MSCGMSKMNGTSSYAKAADDMVLLERERIGSKVRSVEESIEKTVDHRK